MGTETAVDTRVALGVEHLRIVRDIVAVHLPGAWVCIFGSRATGRARPFSDLDLLVREPDALSWSQRADLRDAFEASELPFRVDVVTLDDLAPEIATRALTESVDLSGA